MEVANWYKIHVVFLNINAKLNKSSIIYITWKVSIKILLVKLMAYVDE